MSKREVTPLDHGVSKGALVSTGLVLDGLLDVETLRSCVFRLLESWPELSFRLKRKPGSLGEMLSIPISDGSSVDFRHRSIESFLRDVSPLPTPSATIVSAHPIDTARVNELLEFDTWGPASYGVVARPILVFRVTLLKDATLLTMVTPHVVVDGAAIAEILRAVAVLYRGEQLPPRPADPHPDLLSLLPPPPAEDAPADDAYDPAQHMTTGNWAAVRYIYDCLKTRWNGVEERLVHFPGPLLTRIRDEARGTAGLGDAASKGLPVSLQDVACALLVKIYAQSVSSQSAPFDFYHASDMSPFFPGLPTPYLHNAFTMLHIAFPSAAHIRTAAPAALAAHVRAAVNAQRTSRGAAAQVAWHAAHRGDIFIVPRAARAHGWGMLSSWTKMRLETLDFGAGVRVVRVRPRLRFALGCEIVNAAFASADGLGGVWADVRVPAGRWDAVWAAADLAAL